MDLNDDGMPKVKNNPPLYPIFVIPIFLLLSIPVRMLIKRFSLPLAPNVFHVILAAIFTAILCSFRALHDSYSGISGIHPDYFLSIFLPVFIFSRIYRMDFYIFVRCLPQTIIISTFGFLLNAIILGYIIRDILHPKWNSTMGIIAGIIAVPVQPNYIINMFKELAKYKYLGTMLESETILTFIPVIISFDLSTGYNEGIISKWYHFLLITMRYLIGGIIAGLIMGKITALLMCWLYNEPLGALSVSIGMTFLTYYLCVFIFAFSGILAIICVVCFIAVEKHRFSLEVDGCLFSFWGTLNYVVEIIILMNCTTEIIIHISRIFDIREIYGTIITYFAANITRFFVFLLMGLILNRLAYDVNLRCLMVLGWSGVKGNVNLLLILLLLEDEYTFNMAQEFILEVMIYTFLSLGINSTSMRMTLKLIGLSELSTARRTNMNNCMRFIMEKRLCIINILKLNRYLSDANWSLVRLETVMKHPYKLKVSDDVDDDEDDEFMWNSRNMICPDCLKEVPLEISDKEMEEMLKDAQVKILKAKKVSVIKQYEKGTINKNCLQVLANALEVMIESNPKSNSLELRAYLRQDTFLVFIHGLLMKVNSDRLIKPPKSTFRRLCFYLMMHKGYDFVNYLIIIICTVMIILIRTHPLYTWKMFQLYTMWLFFVIDFLIKIYGLSRLGLCDGVKKYFKSYWNVFDFVMLTEEFVYLDCTLYMYIRGGRIIYYYKPMKYIRTFRIFKIIYLLRSLSRKMLQVIEYKIDTKICFGYDLATAIVNSCDEITDIISQLIEIRVIRDILLKQVRDEKHILIKEMEQVQKERPWIAITVKTKQAIRTTLNAMEESLNDLKMSGFVDNIEYTLIFKEIFEKQKFLRNMKFVQPSPPKVIFNEVPWMAEDEEIIDFLYKHVQTVSWDAGEVVCKDGSFSSGIYIVVTGLLRLKYKPKEQTLENLREFGKIPVVDYLSTLKFDTKLDDNIMSGNSIGELSVLTGRPYDCNIITDSPSQAYLLTTEVMKEAMRLNSNPVRGLETRIWKCSTINLAVALLMDIPLYQSFTQEQIKFKLEKSFAPNLRCYKMFVVTEMMDDIILLEGIASDYNSGELFVAPMVIPRTIQKLILPQSSYLEIEEKIDTRLLIIPMGDAKAYEIMEFEEEVAELVSIASSKCLLHSVLDHNAKKKKLKRKMEKESRMFTKESDLTIFNESDNKFEVLDDVQLLQVPVSSKNTVVSEQLIDKLQTLQNLSDEDKIQAGPSANKSSKDSTKQKKTSN